MSIVDKLRKLGIFRYGLIRMKYKNGTQRPIEFQKQDVFNADKDMVNSRKDSKNRKKTPERKS